MAIAFRVLITIANNFHEFSSLDANLRHMHSTCIDSIPPTDDELRINNSFVGTDLFANFLESNSRPAQSLQRV